MAPKLKYTKKFIMSDGLAPSLTLEKTYDIDCVYLDEHLGDVATIINDANEVHYFDLEDVWTKEHFTVLGDIEEVREQI